MMNGSRDTCISTTKSAKSNSLFGILKLRAGLGLVALIVLSTSSRSFAQTPSLEEGFVSLFDGKTLEGWKIGDNADLFQVHDGMIVMECPATNKKPAHLFYDGEV